MPTTDAKLPVVHLFTDGGCSGNPGPGGWAFILAASGVGQRNGKVRRRGANDQQPHGIDGGDQGLQALKCRSQVELFTDSEYVRQGLMQWMAKWKANGWRRKVGTAAKLGEVKNLELWQAARSADRRSRIGIFHRVAGHSGHPENDRCDELAVAAYQRYLKSGITP